MSDFPRGGDVQATRARLDKEGCVDVFKGWKADAILGKSDEFVRSKFPMALEGQDQAEMLCGLLNTARQSTAQVAVVSPRYANSVYVLLLEDEPIGTAFAVQCGGPQNKLITAAHCVLENGLEIPGARFYITLKVERNRESEILIESRLEVGIHDKSVENDWAVLMLTDAANEFDVRKCLEICHDIPRLATEPTFKIYHCPAGEFNAVRSNSLEAVSTVWMRPIAMTLARGELNFPTGLSSGSSGGAVVDRDSKVVAMHPISASSVLTYDEAIAAAEATITLAASSAHRYLKRSQSNGLAESTADNSSVTKIRHIVVEP